jgi:hypothetical protein
MSAITLEGKLYMKEQDRAFKGEDVVRFLKHLMRQIPGKLLVVWDGSPIAAVRTSDRSTRGPPCSCPIGACDRESTELPRVCASRVLS